jgi:hypothetical protein
MKKSVLDKYIYYRLDEDDNILDSSDLSWELVYGY